MAVEILLNHRMFLEVLRHFVTGLRNLNNLIPYQLNLSMAEPEVMKYFIHPTYRLQLRLANEIEVNSRPPMLCISI